MQQKAEEQVRKVGLGKVLPVEGLAKQIVDELMEHLAQVPPKEGSMPPAAPESQKQLEGSQVLPSL